MNETAWVVVTPNTKLHVHTIRRTRSKAITAYITWYKGAPFEDHPKHCKLHWERGRRSKGWKCIKIQITKYGSELYKSQPEEIYYGI